MPATWLSHVFLRIFSWYQRMEPAAKNALWAAFFCYATASMSIHALEFTFIVQTPFMDARNHVPTFCSDDAKGVAESIFACTMLASFAGGIFFGWLADRRGRARTLQITILCIAAATFMCGLAWWVPREWPGQLDTPLLRGLLAWVKIGDPVNFRQCAPLGFMCIVTGLSFGGAWTAAAVLAGEWAHDADRARTVGAMQSGWVAGGLLSFLILRLLNEFVKWLAGLEWLIVEDPEATACCFMFLLGPVLAVLAFFFARPRWPLDDAPVFRAVRPAGTNLNPIDMVVNFARIFTNVSAARTWLMIFVLSAGAMAGYYATTTLLPDRLEQYPLTKSLFFIVFMAGSFFGYHFGGYISDRLGRHYAFALFAAFACLFTVILGAKQPSDTQTQLSWFIWSLSLLLTDRAALVLTFCLGLSVSAVFSGMGAFFTELYPTSSRGLRQGSSYNFGRQFAFNLGLLGLVEKNVVSMQDFIVIAYLLVILAALLLPETVGHALTAEADQEEVHGSAQSDAGTLQGGGDLS